MRPTWIKKGTTDKEGKDVPSKQSKKPSLKHTYTSLLRVVYHWHHRLKPQEKITHTEPRR